MNESRYVPVWLPILLYHRDACPVVTLTVYSLCAAGCTTHTSIPCQVGQGLYHTDSGLGPLPGH